MLHPKGAITPRAATIVLIVALVIFAALAATAPAGRFDAAEHSFMLSLRNASDLSIPAGPAWFQYFAEQATALGGWPLLTLLSLTVIGFFLMRRQWDFALILIAVITGESVITGQLKHLFDRARPDFLPHLVEATSKSFPSGHASSAAAVYLTLGLMLANILEQKPLRIYALSCAISLATLTGLSRIYLGVHYPTDVLAGWCVGSAWASAVWLAAYYADPLLRRGR